MSAAWQIGVTALTSHAMLRLGLATRGLHGLTKDDVLALQWMQKAAALGDTQAMVTIASFQAVGRGGLSRNTADTLAWGTKKRPHWAMKSP